MIKYIKWISLVIVIILIVVLGIKFINYNNALDEEVDVDELQSIYNSVWIKSKTITYMDDGSFSEIDAVMEDYYITFDKDIISYCRWDTLECVDYKYTYNDGSITINSEYYFLPKGTYIITFNDSEMELTQEIRGDDVTYHFVTAMG